LSKLPASSIGSTTEAVVPAPAVDPVEVAPPPEERESGGRRLRRLARRLRPGPRTLVQSHHLHMSLAFLVPLMLLAMTALLAFAMFLLVMLTNLRRVRASSCPAGPRR
jgi:hypothetical protein